MTPLQEKIVIANLGRALCDIMTVAQAAMPEGPEQREIISTCLQASQDLLAIIMEIKQKESTPEPTPENQRQNQEPVP